MLRTVGGGQGGQGVEAAWGCAENPSERRSDLGPAVNAPARAARAWPFPFVCFSHTLWRSGTGDMLGLQHSQSVSPYPWRSEPASVTQWTRWEFRLSLRLESGNRVDGPPSVPQRQEYRNVCEHPPKTGMEECVWMYTCVSMCVSFCVFEQIRLIACVWLTSSPPPP